MQTIFQCLKVQKLYAIKNEIVRHNPSYLSKDCWKFSTNFSTFNKFYCWICDFEHKLELKQLYGSLSRCYLLEIDTHGRNSSNEQNCTVKCLKSNVNSYLMSQLSGLFLMQNTEWRLFKAVSEY